jgi:hypothetical protein
MKNWSIVTLVATFAFAMLALAGCSHSKPAPEAAESPAVSQSAPADSLNLGASSAGRAR